MAHMAMEVFPETQIFAESTISTARHIAQNPIELEILALATLLHIGELAGIIVRDEERWQVQLCCLMSQKESTFGVCVIGNQHACIHLFAILVQSLQDLDAFGAWGSAHIKYGATRVNLQERHRNHRHFLLAEDLSTLCRSDNKSVELFEFRILSQLNS